MKKLVYIIYVFLLISCNNSSEVNSLDSMIIKEKLNLEDFGYTKSSFNVSNLAQQKLQEYYDLVLLKEQHPEFGNDIELQLKNLANTSLEIPKSTEAININSVKVISNQKLSDSTLRMLLKYQLTTNNGTSTDTIIAIIKTKTIIVDGEGVTSTKLVFKND